MTIGTDSTIGRDTIIENDVSIGRLCMTGPGSLIGEKAQIGARSYFDSGGVEVEAGVQIPADSQVEPGTKLTPANARRYVHEDGPGAGLQPTVTAAERAEKAEIARERSGAGVAVRGAGRDAGGTPAPKREQNIALSSARTH